MREYLNFAVLINFNLIFFVVYERLVMSLVLCVRSRNQKTKKYSNST